MVLPDFCSICVAWTRWRCHKHFHFLTHFPAHEEAGFIGKILIHRKFVWDKFPGCGWLSGAMLFIMLWIKWYFYVFILLLRTTGQWLRSSYCHHSTLLLVSWVFVSVLWYHSGAECHFPQKQVWRLENTRHNWSTTYVIDWVSKV